LLHTILKQIDLTSLRGHPNLYIRFLKVNIGGGDKKIFRKSILWIDLSIEPVRE